MDAVSIQESPELRAALESVSSVAPQLELLRDGAMLAGCHCRVTAGVIALMQIAQNGVFFFDEEVHTNGGEYDIFEAIYLSSDEHLDEAVLIADDRPRLEVAVQKFMGGFRRKSRAATADQFTAWIGTVSECIQGMGDDEDDNEGLSDWWIDAVDIVVSQYGWTEEFVMWRLPLPRLVRYQDSIVSRLNGRPRSDEISDSTIRALEALAKERSKGNPDG